MTDGQMFWAITGALMVSAGAGWAVIGRVARWLAVQHRKALVYQQSLRGDVMPLSGPCSHVRRVES